MICRAWGYTATETHTELLAFPLDHGLSEKDEVWLGRTNAGRTIRRYFQDNLGRDNARLFAEAREYVATLARDIPIASKEGRLKQLDSAARRIRNTALMKRDTELGVAAERALVGVLKEARLESEGMNTAAAMGVGGFREVQVRAPLGKIAGLDLATVTLEELEQTLLEEIDSLVDCIPGLRERAIEHLLRGSAGSEATDGRDAAASTLGD